MKEIWKLFQEVLSVLPPGAARFLRGYSISLGILAIFDAVALVLLAVTINPMATGRELVLPVIGVVSQGGLLVMLGLVCVLIIAKGVFAYPIFTYEDCVAILRDKRWHSAAGLAACASAAVLTSEASRIRRILFMAVPGRWSRPRTRQTS